MSSSLSSNAGSQCRAALVTPAGRGAVATIVVAGRGTTELVSRFFTPATPKSLVDFPFDRIVFGRWQNAAAVGEAAAEELVVCRRGDERIEIHCHGGDIAARAILESLATRGCQEIAWSELLFADHQDALQAQAWQALTQARTERTAAILFDQFHGALSRSLAEIRGHLVRGGIPAALTRLHELARTSELGAHLTKPWRVVLAGPPNVGKSSLINAILGYERSIVFDQPGTTRDVVTASTVLDGWPIELSDTAGLRASSDSIESDGVARAQAKLSAADLLLLVVDAREPFATSQFDNFLLTPPRQTLTVFNKCDLDVPGQLNDQPGIATSATTGAGLKELIAAIVHRLIPQPPAPGSAVLFAPLHLEKIAAVIQLLELPMASTKLASALASLDELASHTH